MVRVLINSPVDRCSIPGRVIQKTQKIVLDASWLNSQHYKVRIKGKCSNSGKGIAPYPTSQCRTIEKGAFRSLSTTVDQLTHTHTHTHIYIYNRPHQDYKFIFGVIDSYQYP